jgi:signal transduction histidine kinase
MPGNGSAQEAFLFQVLASSTDCIKILNLEGDLEFMSEGGLCVMEIDDFEPFSGACWANFWQGKDHAKALDAVATARVGGTGKFQGFTPTAKGNMRFWEVVVTPIRGADGQPQRLLAISRDITEQRKAEEALETIITAMEAKVIERTQELQKAVEEAEAFNYSISHDLRAPLRAISSTSSILLNELGPQIPLAYRNLLDRQKTNAGRMAQLIDELLQLSRLARVSLHRVPLDMSAEAQSVLQIENGCQVEIEVGMSASGDPVLVRSLYQNLIGNACKFSPLGGKVVVGQTGPVFWVKDEGIGFDMTYAPKVFLPFERLVTEQEFPGTGIGLANVKRVVERHGGKVWVEAEPGKGATFFFTLSPQR